MKTVDAFPNNSASTSRDSLALRANSVFFGQIAQELTNEAQKQKYETPIFRSPPQILGVTRTITKHDSAKTVDIAIAIRGRSKTAVASDAIEGVLEANPQLSIVEKMGLREQLWERATNIIFSGESQNRQSKSGVISLAKTA